MSQALFALIDLTEDKVDQASRALALARQHHQTAIERLGLVEGYRDQYQQGVAGEAMQGVSGQRLRHQHHFIERLHDAVRQQTQDVHFKAQAIEAALQKWQLAQTDLKKYQVLLDRATLAARRKQDKSEQKANDEYAARIYRANCSGG
ncbi:MAG: flagellar export protein FliJ [Burkholderiaceae bacterium]|jgi:flagellar FliJ protein